MSTSSSLSTRPLLAVVVVASVVVGFAIWWGSRGGYARRASDGMLECQQRYQQAATFKDTARVDLSYPAAYWQQTSSKRGPQTCGDLRLAGRLR